MKVFLPKEPLIVAPEDVEMVYRSLLHYAERLRCESKWTDHSDVKENILAEADEYQELINRLFKSHMMLAMCGHPVEREDKA